MNFPFFKFKKNPLIPVISADVDLFTSPIIFNHKIQ